MISLNVIQSDVGRIRETVLGKVIFVTSFKGGAGKTTVSANVASALAALGYCVVAVDGDYDMRCLDLVLGLESRVLYDSSDVIGGRCGLSDALATVPGDDSLSFLAAPMSLSSYDVSKGIGELLDELRVRFDYVIVDSSAKMTPVYREFAANSDEQIVVSLHQSSGIRAAESTAVSLAGICRGETRLVINQFRFGAAQRGALPRISDIISRTSVRLLGVVPYDPKLPLEQESGMLACRRNGRKQTAYEIAMMNISRRLAGQNVPLLDGLYSRGRKERDLY